MPLSNENAADKTLNQGSRQGIQALNQAGIDWQMVYTANSLSGLMAAVKAGLAVTVRARNAASGGTEILTPRLELPELPPVYIVLRQRMSSEAGGRLIEALSRFKLDAQ